MKKKSTCGWKIEQYFDLLPSSLNIRFGLDESAQLMDLFEKTLYLEITDSTIDFLLFTVSMGVSFGDFSSSAGHIRAIGKTGGNQGQLFVLDF